MAAEKKEKRMKVAARSEVYIQEGRDQLQSLRPRLPKPQRQAQLVLLEGNR